MYEPKYVISDRLLDLVVKLEVDKSSLAALEVPTNIRQKATENAKALSLFHLGHMLDSNITVKDAEKLAEGRKLGTEDLKTTILTNFRNALEFNRSTVADSYVELDLALLLHLNKIMLAGWKEGWEVKLRGNGAKIEDSNDDWLQFRDEKLDSGDIGNELGELLDWYKLAGTGSYPLLRIAVLIYRLIEIAPFIAGNKFTIMAVADFLLNRYGYISKTNLVVTRNFDINDKEYAEAWQICRQNYDLGLWFERFARAMGKDMLENKIELDRQVGEEKDKASKQPFLDLNKRQLKVLRYLQTIPTVKREDYCQMMDVSTMTAYRDLTYLVDKKLIKVDGEGRGTRYMLTTR